MFTYLYTLTYDDEGNAASAQHYTVHGMNMATSQAETTMTEPLSAEEQSRHAKMMNNVVVCAIAQKYDISELKELATKKFRELLWLEAPSHGLPDIIDAVFETTSTKDPGLRNVAAEYCTHYSTKILTEGCLCNMIKDHGELGLDVLREVDLYAVKENQQKELLRGKIVTLQDDLTQMIKKLSAIRFPAAYNENNQWINAQDKIDAHLLKLKSAHDNVKI